MRWNKKLKSASLYLILSVNIKRRINVIIRSPFTPLHFFTLFRKIREVVRSEGARLFEKKKRRKKNTSPTRPSVQNR